MTDHEQWLSDTLMSIKGDIGELKGLKDDVAEVKKASDGLLQATATIRSDIEVMKTVRLAHQNDITMLSNRIGVLDQKLENMHTVDTWEEFMKTLDEKSGFISAHWTAHRRPKRRSKNFLRPPSAASRSTTRKKLASVSSQATHLPKG